MTRIIVAFPKVENGKNIKNVLVRNGYQVVCVCTNGAQVIQEANGLQDGLVLCTYKLSFPQRISGTRTVRRVSSVCLCR